MCVRERISGITYPIFNDFLLMFAARSFSGAQDALRCVAICYVFPASWMTSRLHLTGIGDATVTQYGVAWI